MAIDLDEQDGQTPLDPDELAALIPLGQGSYGLSMSVKSEPPKRLAVITRPARLPTPLWYG